MDFHNGDDSDDDDDENKQISTTTKMGKHESTNNDFLDTIHATMSKNAAAATITEVAKTTTTAAVAVVGVVVPTKRPVIPQPQPKRTVITMKKRTRQQPTFIHPTTTIFNTNAGVKWHHHHQQQHEQEQQQKLQQQQLHGVSKMTSLGSSTKGLPSFLSRDKHERLIASCIAQEEEENNNKATAKCSEFDNEYDDDYFDAVLFDQPTEYVSDTYQMIRNLQSSNETSIEIPFVAGWSGGNYEADFNSSTATYMSGGTSSSSSSIRGVLECQIYERLLQSSDGTNNNIHNIVSEELNALLRHNICRTLSSTSSNNNNTNSITGGGNFNVIITTSDYIQAVRYASGLTMRRKTDDDDGTDPKQQQQQQHDVFEWFIKHLKDFTGQQISYTELQASWYSDFHLDPNTNTTSTAESGTLDTNLSTSSSFAVAIQLLQEEWQVLMASSPMHHGHSYQLWLPGWGRYVIKGWNTTNTKLLAELKRSLNNTGERSYQSLQKQFQYKNPVPLPVVMAWLVSEGLVVRAQRPFGLFIQLSKAMQQEHLQQQQKQKKK